MYGQTGSGKTYTMLGDHSKEIREKNSISTVNSTAAVASAKQRSLSRTKTPKRDGLPIKRDVSCTHLATPKGIDRKSFGSRLNKTPRVLPTSNGSGCFSDLSSSCLLYTSPSPRDS